MGTCFWSTFVLHAIMTALQKSYVPLYVLPCGFFLVSAAQYVRKRFKDKRKERFRPIVTHLFIVVLKLLQRCFLFRLGACCWDAAALVWSLDAGLVISRSFSFFILRGIQVSHLIWHTIYNWKICMFLMKFRCGTCHLPFFFFFHFVWNSGYHTLYVIQA